MRHGLVCLGVILLTGFSISTAQQQEKQEKSKESAAPAAPTAVAATTDAAKPPAAAERKNPVKATPEGIAVVK